MFDKREIEAVMRVMESGCLSDYQGNWSDNFYGGEEVQALEREWARYFKVNHAVACNSATSGLWMALNAVGLNNEDEVIVSPYTMTCSASLPLLFGAKPVFADIEPDYFCMDPLDLERKITSKTKAVIVVDLFGQAHDSQKIRSILNSKSKEHDHKIYLIVDAAQAPGTKFQGKYTATLGDIGVYSLNRHKHIHCGEGSVCVTDDVDLALRLRLSMNHAEAVINDIELKETHEETLMRLNKMLSIKMVGMNLRMTELSAAIAREQLKKLDYLLERYRKDAEMFPVLVRPGCEHSFYRYAWLGDIPEWVTMVHDVSEFTYKKGYIRPIFQMPAFRSRHYDEAQCPVVQQVNNEIVLAWRKEPY